MTTRSTPLHIRVFLSSPGDVADERSVALQVLERIQYDPLLRGQITVEVVAWDKPGAGTPMLATMTPQEAINQGLPTPAECDIVVVIFWARMGTPLPDDYTKPDGSRYLSGTEWEYEDAVQGARATGRPLVVVYRRIQRTLLDPSDPAFKQKLEQWQRVEAFFAGFANPDGSIRQGYNAYQTPDEFREKFEIHLKGLIKRLLDETPPERPTPPERSTAPLWPGSPFPGLRAFTPADAPIFFGRGAETDALVERLSDPACRLIAVVGASGSGKSSLVGAGLIPRLATNAIEGSRDWVAVRFTPGELASGDPFEALAVALERDLPALRSTPARDLTAQLHEYTDSLGKMVESTLAGRPAWAKLVLFIDQFEEVFSLVRPQHVAPFVDLLADVASAPRLRVVLTLRADFYAQCVELPRLASLLETTTYPLAAPEMGALYEMISRPADLAGLAFEEGLVNRILDDTGTEPGALALMAYTLDELYRACEQPKCLTHTIYQALGGVQGAIGQRAETTFAALDQDAQASLPDVFREIAEVDERGVAIRRRARLEQVAQTDAARRLVDGLTGARLLVQGQDETGQSVVEVAHEALLRSWARLARWIEDTQDELRLLRQVRAVSEEWERAGRDPADLLTGTRLERAQIWLKTNGLTPLQRAFLAASVTEEKARRERERKRQRNLNQARLGLVLVVALMAILGVIFLAAQSRTQRQAAEAAHAGVELAQSLAATSDANLREQWRIRSLNLASLSEEQLKGEHYQEALLLALESLSHYEDGVFTTEGSKALTDALFAPIQETAYIQHEGVKHVVWNTEGTRLLSWADDGTVRVWDTASGAELLTLCHAGSVNGARWNTDETRLLSWAGDDTMRVWDALTGENLLTLHPDGGVVGAAWNNDGTCLLSWGIDIRVWNALTGENLLTLHPDEGPVGGAMWNEDGTRLLSWAGDGTVRIWNAQTGKNLLTLRHDPGDSSRYSNLGAAWNKAGTRLLSWAGSTVRVWNAVSGKELFTLHHENGVNGVAWNADGTRLLSWANDIRVWDALTGENLLTFRRELTLSPDESFVHAAWNEDETRLLSWSVFTIGKSIGNGVSAQIWDALTGGVLRTLSYYPEPFSNHSVIGVAWNDDGTHLLIRAEDGAIRVWDVQPGEDSLLTLYHDPDSTYYDVIGVAWNNDGTRLLSWSPEGGTVRVWDALTGENLLTLHPDEGIVGVVWNDDGTRLLSWSTDNTVRVWDATSGVELLTLHHEGSVNGVAWSDDETRLLSWSGDDTVRVWDALTGENLLTLHHDPSDYGVRGAVWNADETRLLSWSTDNTVRVWDAPSGENLLTLRHENSVNGAAWNDDESRLLSWVGTNVRVWDARTGEVLLVLLHDGDVNGTAWSPDGTRLLSWSGYKTVRVWDAGNGMEQLTLRPDEGVAYAAWNSDGTRILSWSGSTTGQVWDAQTGETLLVLHHDPIMHSAMYASGAVWNGDGTQVLSWAYDGVVRVWNVLTGEVLLTLGHGAFWDGAAWNADETRLVSWTWGGVMKVWYGNIESYIVLAEARKTRELNNEQRAEFFLPTLEPTVTPTSWPTITPLPARMSSLTPTP